MAKSGKAKTNALRQLDSQKIEYKVYEYNAPDGFLDGVSVAKATGMDVSKVYKTLVTVGQSREHYVCVIPVAEELDLKKAARHFGEKKIEMIRAKEITNLTGYIKGGCSPMGMKKSFKTAVDIHARELESIVVSAGKVGLQAELSVSDLLSAIPAETVDLTVCDEK